MYVFVLWWEEEGGGRGAVQSGVGPELVRAMEVCWVREGVLRQHCSLRVFFSRQDGWRRDGRSVGGFGGGPSSLRSPTCSLTD